MQRLPAHLASLPGALEGAAHAWLAPGASLEWDPVAAFAGHDHVTVCADAAEAARAAAAAAQAGDAVVFMSNSGASGAAGLLAAELEGRRPA